MPCERVRYEPSLSYAQLSKINVERLVVQSEARRLQLEVRVCACVCVFARCVWIGVGVQ